MTLTTYNPFDLQIDRLFEEAFQTSGRKATVWSPYCNAWEDGDRFCLEMALPGWDSKDVKITVEEDRKSTRLNSSHGYISYAVFCLKKKKKKQYTRHLDE